MDTLQVAWPNEDRRYERIKTDVITTTKKAQAIVDELKRLGIHGHSVEVVRQIYLLNCLRFNSSVKPHRQTRKQTVEFRGTSQPERKDKYIGGRRSPKHIKQQYQNTDMWYTSDDKRRYKKDLTSLQIVTDYKEGVDKARKRAIVPRQKITNSKPTSNSKTTEDRKWRLHMQRVNKERAELANR